MKLSRLLLFAASFSAQHQTDALFSTDLHRAFWADYNQFNHNYATAYSWYQKLLQKPDTANYMYKGLIHLFAQTKQYPQILALINTLDDAFAHDVDIQLLFAQTLQYAGNQAAANQKIVKLSSMVKDNQQIAFNAAQIYFRAKEPENALLTIQDYISSQSGNPNNFIFHFLAAQIYLSLNKKELALKQISSCIALQPQFDKAWLMLALLHEKLNNIPKAIEAYQTYMQVSKTTPDHIKQHILALKNSPFDVIDIMLQQHNYTQALELINHHLHTHPDDTRALLSKITTLNALQLSDEVFELAASLVEKNPYDQLWFDALQKVAQEQHKEQNSIKKLSNLQTIYTDSPYIALYLGILCGNTGNIIDALAYYDTALKLATDNSTKATILTHWMTHIREYKLYQFMPELIQQATALSHESPKLHTFVAYWYATKGNNHARAFDILKKVLPQEQHNPHLADTLGRLFYKQEQYFLAATLFRRGLNLHPDNSHIARHLVKSYDKQWEQYSMHTALSKHLPLQNSTIKIAGRI